MQKECLYTAQGALVCNGAGTGSGKPHHAVEPFWGGHSHDKSTGKAADSSIEKFWQKDALNTLSKLGADPRTRGASRSSLESFYTSPAVKKAEELLAEHGKEGFCGSGSCSIGF